MRNLLLILVIGLLGFGLVVNEASAKRFGGGRSFGVQRSHSSLFSSANAQKAKPLGQARSNRWGGMLGGLLIGGLLASLFMGHGLASGLFSWLLVGGLLLVLFNLFKRKNTGFQFAGEKPWQQAANTPFPASGSAGVNAPAGFETEAFLRNAKRMFIRLQAAYDQKNLQDLSEFTAPEVFAEIKMQFEERGNEPNSTDVLQLNAELLDLSRQVDSTIASVRFTGSVQENSEPVTSLDEIWHFRQFGSQPNWVVGGIQQAN
ncbi:MAG: Tim44-like domain-containing protein [Tatlockia sp.]